MSALVASVKSRYGANVAYDEESSKILYSPNTTKRVHPADRRVHHSDVADLHRAVKQFKIHHPDQKVTVVRV